MLGLEICLFVFGGLLIWAGLYNETLLIRIDNLNATIKQESAAYKSIAEDLDALAEELDALKNSRLMESQTIAISASSRVPSNSRGGSSYDREEYEIKEKLNLAIMSYIAEKTKFVMSPGYPLVMRATCIISLTSDDNIIDLGSVD